MKPEGSLPHSQVPATCSYPEPDQSSPCPLSHLLKILLNIILPSMPGSSKWSLSLKFPHQNPVYTSALPHTCYMPRPSHCPRFDHPSNIEWGVQIIKLLTVHFSPFLCTLSILGPNILLSNLFSNNVSVICWKSQRTVQQRSMEHFVPLIKLPTRQLPAKTFICAQATLNEGLVTKVCDS